MRPHTAFCKKKFKVKQNLVKKFIKENTNNAMFICLEVMEFQFEDRMKVKVYKQTVNEKAEMIYFNIYIKMYTFISWYHKPSIFTC